MAETKRHVFERFAKAALTAEGRTHKLAHSTDARAILGRLGDTEELGIVSVRVDDLSGMAAGSILSECGTCHQPVPLGPASQDILVLRPKTRVMCMQCATAELERGKPDGPHA